MSDETELAELLSEPSPSLAEELRKVNYIYITGMLTEESLRYPQEDLLLRYSERFSDTLHIVVNSVGGDLNATFALVNLMELMPFKIQTIALGICASASTYIVAAGTSGLRHATKDTLFLSHRFSTGAMGTQPQLLAATKGWKMEHDREIEFWKKHSNLRTREAVESKLLKEQDTWLTAKQAMKLGMIDGIIK